MSVIAQPAAVRPGARAARTGSIHLPLALACAAVGVIGFAPSFWFPLLTGQVTLAPILYLHALVFYGWLTLFVAQAWLVAAGRTARHRELGVLGVAVATAMCFVGVAAAVGRLFALAMGVPPPAAGVEPPPVMVTVPAGLVTDLLLVPALWHDWKTLGRVHPAYVMAGTALVASQLLRVPLAASPAWHAVAGAVSSLLP